MLPNARDILADVTRALQEDVGDGDVTAVLLPERCRVKAHIISREPMVVCGQAWVNMVFATLDEDIHIQWLVAEGSVQSEPTVLCEISGWVRPLLTGERTALNFLQTLSGTATKTHQFCQALAGTHTKLLDTRKTLPGLRKAQKYAVQCGGAHNHRMGLYDAFLIKENHIKAAGSITAAVQQARGLAAQLMIEVEVETWQQFQEALSLNLSRIMLDNFDDTMLAEAVLMSREKSCTLEVSGGVSLANVRALAQTGIDYISVGALTKSVQAIDLSLLIREVL